MDIYRLNNIALKTVGIIIAVSLVIGGAGACVNHQYLKGVIGIIAAPIIVYMAFQPASIKSWGIVVGVFVVAMFIVGVIGN
jgi:hypothetical protein